MNRHSTRWFDFGLLVLAALLSACGGGSSTGNAPPVVDTPAPTSYAVSGTAASGRALANARIQWKCRDGSGGETISREDGAWGASASSIAVPCLVQSLDASGTRLHSPWLGSGTVNITPFTDMSVARMAGTHPADLFREFSAAGAANLTATQLASAQQDLRTVLHGVADVSSIDDFVSTPFKAANGTQAGDAIDQTIDATAAALSSKGGSFQALSARLASNAEVAGVRQALIAGDSKALTGFGFDRPWMALRTPSALPEWNKQPNVVVIGKTVFYPSMLGLLRSPDEGKSWQLVARRFTAGPVAFMGKLVAANGTSLLTSDDDGVTWHLTAELPVLGYDANGAPDRTPISDIYAAGGKLHAVSVVIVWSDNGGYRRYRRAETSNLIAWSSFAGPLMEGDLPPRTSLGVCQTLSPSTWMKRMRTADGTVVDSLDTSSFATVKVYDPGSGQPGDSCTLLGIFNTGIAPGEILPVSNSALLVGISSLGKSAAYTRDGRTWTPVPLPALSPLTVLGFAQLGDGRLLMSAQHGNAPVLQVFDLDGGGRQDLLRNVRWDLKRIASRGKVIATVGGGNKDPNVKSGIVLASQDGGDSWNEAMVFATPGLADVAVNDKGVFVAVGLAGTIVYSDANGTHWYSAIPVTNKNLVAIAWGGDRFLAITSDGDSISSSDGVTWSPVQAGNFQNVYPYTHRFVALTYHDGRFVMAHDVVASWGTPLPLAGLWESTDGKTWSHVEGTTSGWKALSVCADSLLAIGPRRFGASTTRATGWRFKELDASFDEVRALGCAKGTLAALANPTLDLRGPLAQLASARDQIKVSLDLGTTWTGGVVELAGNASQINYVGGRWFLLGDQDLLLRAP